MTMQTNTKFFQNNPGLLKKINTNQKDNLSALVTQITTVDNVAIESRIAFIAEQKELKNAIDIAGDADLQFLCTYYCFKSGQPVGNISAQDFNKLIDIQGKERAQYTLSRRAISHIAPHWLYTDGDSLEQLTEQDPIGYCVYAASAILKCYQPGYRIRVSPNDTETNNRAADFNFLRNKVKLWNRLQEVSLKDIVRCNEMMRRYLMFVETAKAYGVIDFKAVTIADLNVITFTQEVGNAIRKIIMLEFKAGRLKKSISYSDIVDLNITYGGHSNFRGQRKLHAASGTENVLAMLKDFMPELSALEEIGVKARNINKDANKTKIQSQTGGKIKLKLGAEKPKTNLNLSFAQKLNQHK